MAVKAAFIGACGATLRHVLAWTLLDGHKAAALVRDHSKLKKTLLDLGVSEEIQQSQLIVVKGSSRDVSTVRSLLLNDPQIIFSGITSTWKLRFNPFHPIAMDDATITGDSAVAAMQALKDLVSTNSISNSPIYAPISSTGHGSRRDQPLSLIPLYWWLLKEAQTDTAALERVTREAATQKQSGLGGYVMLRPPLLTDGEMKGTKKERAPLARHEILSEMRGQMETYHRRDLYMESVTRILQPCPLPTDACSASDQTKVKDISPRHLEACCNKTVPIYIVPGAKGCLLLHCALHNWLYKKWYRPYRNDIEYHQFIAKLFYPCKPPPDMSTVSLVTLINDLHGRICDQVATYQREVVTLPPPSSSGGPHFRDQEFLILQSLFKAVTIILLEDNFNIRVTDVGKLPVLITLTGEDSGLSQQLNFKSISHHVTKVTSDTAVQVPLHIAIDFINAQNQREIAVSGTQPDPIKSTLGFRNGLSLFNEDFPDIVSSLGGGNEPIEGPSSTWVDTSIHTGWPRVMALDDKRVYQREEERYRWRMLRQLAGFSLGYVRISRRKSI
ncbi:hypothetical protein FCIRC_10591 [Fusarium circinatum]|uniref:NAD(P)-binding domain-containing protein n=1 Tax=Fusarium circinatum TaxID=48490 RepID=A0A8H5T9Y2_FUSCI|nr:hypothetical protein FCIRC_10591 [Fusarium circinatum]